MVFPSVPVYPDHPNWHQLQLPNHHQESTITENPHLHPPPPPPPLPPVGGGGGSVRPGSMVDRARLAKIPQPEAGLKCPRCESTNTKFCYFNNYNLSQPRHFCKTCRRYWTRGGALRNVPVGGGCRRNKRSKSGGSKAQTAAEHHHAGPTKSTSESPTRSSTDISGHFTQLSPQLPFMASLHGLPQYGGGNAGSNLGGFPAASGAASGGVLSADQWRLSFLAGLEPQMNAYSVVGDSDQLRLMTSNSGGNQMGGLKVEESQGLGLSVRNMSSVSENNQFWGGNSWPGFSGINSCSTTHLL